MNILKRLAGLFSAETVVRVATDPRISEPVFMMLRSMVHTPQRWRVSLELPDYDIRDHRQLMKRGNSDTAVTVRIRDRGVGETYEARLMLNSYTISELTEDKMFRRNLRPTTTEGLSCATMIGHPSWLNPQEARELHYALCKLMATRLTRIAEYQNRGKERAEKLARVRAQQRRDEERQRLINVYGGIDEQAGV